MPPPHPLQPPFLPTVPLSSELAAAERAFSPAKLPIPRTSPLAPLHPALSIGLVSGCLGGVAYGLMVGVGPQRVPFAHQGFRAATPMCGVVVGATYGVGLTSVLGYRLDGGGRVAGALARLRGMHGAAAAGSGRGAVRALGLVLQETAGAVLWAPLTRGLTVAGAVGGRMRPAVLRGFRRLRLFWRR